MKRLSKLFHECAYEVEYECVGDSVNYAFLEEKDTLYIYFQGSSQISDWVRTFLFKKKPYKDMEISYKVHRGFCDAWKEVEDIIIEKIQEKVKRNKNRAYVDLEDNMKIKFESTENSEYKWKHIVVVGYSHGGALAGFCHECVWFWRPDLRESGLEGYGFEAPRFYGGFKVKKELQERWEHFTVIRTNNDIVTHCPPVIFGFCHVGNMLKIKGDTSLVWYNKYPKCVKSHYPEVVYDALIRYES